MWSIYVKDDDIQVEREYTPLEGIDEQGQMKFWIKRYPKGEVGRWIHSKRVGDKIEIRGPMRTYPWVDGLWDEVVMVYVVQLPVIGPVLMHAKISGGTGITPFYQLLYSTLLSDNAAHPNTRFTLLHAARTPGDLPPPELLDPILSHAASHPERLRVQLFVTELDGSNSPTDAARELQVGRIGKTAIYRALDAGREPSWWQRLLRLSQASAPQVADKKILFLVCGPEG